MAYFDDGLTSARAVAILAGDVNAKEESTEKERKQQWQEAEQIVHGHRDAQMRHINQHMLQHRMNVKNGRPSQPYCLGTHVPHEIACEYHVEGWTVTAKPSWFPFFSSLKFLE